MSQSLFHQVIIPTQQKNRKGATRKSQSLFHQVIIPTSGGDGIIKDVPVAIPFSSGHHSYDEGGEYLL